jgi:hypothetical protein
VTDDAPAARPHVVAFAAASLAPQSERMIIRLSPTANQTTQMRTAQDMIMTTEAEAPDGGAPGPHFSMTAADIAEGIKDSRAGLRQARRRTQSAPVTMVRRQTARRLDRRCRRG